MAKRILTVILILIMVSAAGNSAFADQKGIVHGGWLLLRETPSYQGKIISSYPTGTVVSILSKSGSWYGVAAPDGLQGYMMGSYLTITGGSDPLPVNSTAYVTSSNGLNVRLRTGPGLNYSVMAAYAPGTACLILGSDSGWYKIQIGTYTGYMMAKYISGTQPSVPTPVTPGTTTVWVTSSNGQGVNLRTGAGKDYQSIGFYPVGTQGQVIQFGNTWTYLQIGNRTGYMMSCFLTTVKPGGSGQGSSQPSPGGKGAYVISQNGRNVNLRSGPGTQFNAIASFPPGTALRIITQGIEWDYVQIQGVYGYMMRKYIYDAGSSPASISNVM